MSTAIARMDDLKLLVKRAEKGDPKALAAIQEHLDAHPELWERYGNVAAAAEHSLISAGFKGALREEAILRKLAAMRAELAGPWPSPLERLLVDRVVICWLQVHYADGIYVNALEERRMSSNALEFYQRRQDRAHWRLLSAIRTLAQVRRLLVPTVQLNIGGQQVNVATPQR